MSEITHNKSKVLSYQKDLTLEELLETMPERQSELINLSVNVAMSTTVENMIHKGDEDFQLLKEHGLIRDGVTEDKFNEVKSSTSDINSGFDIKERTKAYADNGIIKTAADLATEEELKTHQENRDQYVEKMDNYQLQQTEFQKSLAKALAHAQAASENLSAYRDGDSERAIPAQDIMPKGPPQFPTDENGDQIEKPIDPRVSKSNEISDILLIDSGYKSEQRTNEKVKNELAGDITKLTDSSRVTVMASSPAMEDRFVKNLLHELSKKDEVHPVFDSTTEVKDSGYISRKLLAPFDGAISEIKLLEPEIQQAERITHLAYKPVRRMIGEDDQFQGDNLNDTTKEQIKTEYNTVVNEVKNNHGITTRLFKQGDYEDFKFETKPDDKAFEGEELKDRFKELERLRQALHTSAALFTKPAFKEKYFGRIKAINKDRGRDVFPKELIPPREIIETSDLGKVEEYIESGIGSKALGRKVEEYIKEGLEYGGSKPVENKSVEDKIKEYVKAGTNYGDDKAKGGSNERG